MYCIRAVYVNFFKVYILLKYSSHDWLSSIQSSHVTSYFIVMCQNDTITLQPEIDGVRII